MRSQPTPPGLIARSGTDLLYRGAVFGIFLVVAATALSYAQSLAIPITAAILCGLLLGPMQERLERFLPPSLTAGALVLLCVGLVLLGMRLLIIPLELWSDKLPEIWIALKLQLENIRSLVLAVQDATDAVEESAGIENEETQAVSIDAPNLLGSLAIGVPSVAAQLVLFLCSLFFYLAARKRLHTAALALCPNRRTRARVARMLRDCEQGVSRYLGAIAVINTLLGIAVASAFYLIGVPNPIFWGAMAGLLNFVPYIGPAVLTVVLIGVGLLDDNRGIDAYLPATLFLTINFIEAYAVTPAVLGKNLTVEPLVVIISLAFWLWLWGPIGAILAVPLMLVFRTMLVSVNRPGAAVD